MAPSIPLDKVGRNQINQSPITIILCRAVQYPPEILNDPYLERSAKDHVASRDDLP